VEKDFGAEFGLFWGWARRRPRPINRHERPRAQSGNPPGSKASFAAGSRRETVAGAGFLAARASGVAGRGGDSSRGLIRRFSCPR